MLTKEELDKILLVDSTELPLYLGIQDAPLHPKYYFEFQKQLSIYRKYLETLEEFFKSQREGLEEETNERNARISSALDKIEKDVREEKIPWYDPSGFDRDIAIQLVYQNEGILPDQDNELENLVEFAKTFRNSFFANLYGFFEANLVGLYSLTKEYLSVNGPRTKYDFLQRNEVDRLRVLESILPFLKTIDFDIASNNAAWSDLNQYKEIRNKILHANGRLAEEKKSNSLKSFINRSNSLSKDETEIRVSRELCENVLCDIEENFFLSALVPKLANWLRE